MDILGIGPLELVLILVIALMVFGPDKLPEIGAKMGKGVRELRQLSREITAGVNTITEPMEELRKPFDEAGQIAGQISAGDLVLFLTYLRAIYSPIKGMARQTTRIAKATVRGEKILELLDMKPEVSDNDQGLSARDIKGDVRFENVSFSYRPDRPVLRDISFRLPAGKTTVILGPTGAGKSTIAKLVLRLYNVRGGTIWLDDRKIEEYRAHSLRKSISSLAQETFLFRMSLAENIAFGKRRATPEEIIEAARIAGADFTIAIATEQVIARGETWRFLRGRAAPAGSALDWTRLEYDDGAWETGAAGFGYGDGDDATVLIDMEDRYSSVYIRKRFEVADPSLEEVFVERVGALDVEERTLAAAKARS